MKVLVLGGAGFIGSVVCPYLREQGDEVTILDTFMFDGDMDELYPVPHLRGDIRHMDDYLVALSETDAVVNLAAISNDPASDLLPELTWEINYKANETIAQLCQASGKRIVFASSCSVYGFSESEVFDETSKLGPASLYAQTKMLSERHYLHESIDSVVLRFATVYGYSPKPRFDLVVNTMIGNAHFKGKVVVNGGQQYRPVVHVKDAAEAIRLALHAENPRHRILNVGSDDQNYQIGALGTLIANEMPGVELVNREGSVDKRSYRVDFGRIVEDLGYKTEYTVADTVNEFQAAFARGAVNGMEDNVHYRVKYLKDLYDKRELLNSLPNRNDYLPTKYAQYGGFGAKGEQKGKPDQAVHWLRRD